MRRNSVIAIGAICIVIAACSPGRGEKTTDTLPIDPTPTAPGEVVVLGGNGRLTGNPRDGAYAVQSPLVPVGPIDAAPDSSLYAPVKVSRESDKAARIAKLAPDGKVHLIGPEFEWGAQDELAIHGGKLWVMRSSSPGQSLKRYSLAGSLESTYFDTDSNSQSEITFTEDRDHNRRDDQQRSMLKCWRTLRDCQTVALGFHSDDTPVIAVQSGELYEAPGNNVLHRWDPPGYAAASKELRQEIEISTRRGFSTTPDLIVSGATGGLSIVMGDSSIHIPKKGNASQVKFTEAGIPSGYGGISWVGGIPEGAGLILAAHLDYPGGPVVLRTDEDGSASAVRPNWGNSCGSKIPPRLTGLTKRADGVLVIAARGCGHVYGMRP